MELGVLRSGGGGGGGGAYVCTAKLPQLGIGLGLVGTYELEHRSHNSYSFPVSLHSVSALERRARPLPSVRA